MQEVMNIDDFLKNHVLTGMKVNEKSNRLLYVMNLPDIAQNRYHKKVFLMNLTTKQSHCLDLPFEPDDVTFYQENIVFSVSKEETTELHLYHLESETVDLLAVLPFKMASLSIIDQQLYFTSVIQDNNRNASVKCSAYAPFFEEGKGVTGNKVIGLMRSDLTGRSIHLMTSLDMDVSQIEYDEAHLRIVFTAFEKKRYKPVASQLFIYDIASDVLQQCHVSGFRIDHISSPTSENIVFAGIDLSVQNRNDHQQLYCVSTTTLDCHRLGDAINYSNEHPNIITDSAYSTSSPMISYDGSVYHIRNIGSRQMIYRTSLSGETDVMDTGLTAIHSYCVTRQGMFIIGLHRLDLHEVYCLIDHQLQCLTQHNSWLKSKLLASPEKIKVLSNQRQIDGWVFTPIHAIQDRKYPGILMIHGGPKMAYSDIYSHDVQLLCALGYFVFYANPSGSGVSGDDFSDIRGHFGDLPYQELMDFTDAVLNEFPQIDKDLLGVTGGSYGGYMTNYIITHTERFSAAVSERGISNLMTSFTSTDIGADFAVEYMKGETPWTSPDTYIKDSPIYLANKIKTPLLLIHGKDDNRCHYTESLNLFTALNFLGLESRFCLFEGENHGLVVRGRPQSKKKRFEEMTQWFDKYLKRGAL